MKSFQAPKQFLGNLDAEAAAALITAAADIALIIDDAGVIRDLAFNSEELARELAGQETWLGRAWIDTVARDSRPKVEGLLRDAAGEANPRVASQPGTLGGPLAGPRWRHVNQLGAGGASVPILYSSVPVGTAGRIVVFGRDLRPISVLQQRLVQAQQSMERDYSRLRQAETRYRLLFQSAAEPVLILDDVTHKVVEANPAADQLFGHAPRRLNGRSFLAVFDAEGRPAVEALFAAVRAGGRADDVRARLAGDGREAMVSASPFRQENASLLLVRVVFPLPDADAIMLPKTRSKLLKLVDSAPDAFVVAAEDGRVLSANAAFLEMIQLTTEDQATGESLERWLGQPGVELEVLIANLHQRGSVRLFASTVRGELGASTEVEISAVAVMNGGAPVFGFAIRDVGPRPIAVPRPGRETHRSVEQLTELIGRVPLKDLVREATDVIERLCIEAALELTNDNRASAADMLGLSRQSLYVKLRRYGLGDLGAEPGEPG